MYCKCLQPETVSFCRYLKLPDPQSLQTLTKRDQARGREMGRMKARSMRRISVSSQVLKSDVSIIVSKSVLVTRAAISLNCLLVHLQGKESLYLICPMMLDIYFNWHQHIGIFSHKFNVPVKKCIVMPGVKYLMGH